MRSGYLSHAKLKAKVKMDQIDGAKEPFFETKKLKSNEIKLKGKDKWEVEKFVLEDIKKYSPFRLEYPEYMQQLSDKSNTQYKVRIYLLSCQNLTAMNNVIDFKSLLAGMYALCSSNPYPMLKVGDGKNDPVARLVRNIDGREFAVEGDLNPEFL